MKRTSNLNSPAQPPPKFSPQDLPKLEHSTLLHPTQPRLQSSNIINTASVDRKVWLVKIPAFVQEAWDAIEGEGIEIGTFRVYNDKSKKATLHIPETIAAVRGIPRNYEVGFSKSTPKNIYVFTEHPESNKAISIAGNVHHEAYSNDDYRRIMAERTKTSQTKRKIELQDDKKGIRQQFIVPNINQAVSGFGSLKKSRDLDKRDRLPREDVQNMLFHIFAKEEYVGMKTFSEVTNQPTAYLKELLGEIATMERRGEHIGMYRLIDEITQRKK